MFTGNPSLISVAVKLAHSPPIQVCAALAVLATVTLQAITPSWKNHLQVDPVVYEMRGSYFLSTGWGEMSFNEYQPGALWFFAFVRWVAGPLEDFDAFLFTLFFVNLVILGAWLFVLAHNFTASSYWAMLLIILSTGPILLFRFEVIVALMVMVGWWSWRRNDFETSALFLGLATATKIYPVIIFPQLITASYIEGGLPKVIRASVAFVCGGMLLVGTWGLFGGTWEMLWLSFKYHLDKPFGVDGLMGGLVPLFQSALGLELLINPRNGVHGFDPSLPHVLTSVISWIWIPAIFLCTWVFWSPKKSATSPSALLLFSYLGLFTVLSKVSNPQYMWWSACFLPLAMCGITRFSKIWLVVILLSSALLLSQVVYPLNYSSFLESFPASWSRSWIFWVNLAKNVLFAIAVAFALVAMWKTRSPKQALN